MARVLEGAEIAGDYERDEAAARAYRLRKMLIWGGAIYLAFIPTDFSYNLMRERDYGLAFVVIRLLVAAPLLFAWLRLRRLEKLSLRKLIVVEAGGTSLVAASIGLMCLLDGGIASPIVVGLVPVLVARGIAIPDRWPRAVALTLAPVLTFAAVIGCGVAIDPSLAGELGPAMLAELILYTGVVAATGVMVVYGSHIAWDLRRNLHRARHVGRYQLQRLIGRGGMGEVWAAWHSGLRQEVALKILPLPRGPSERAARAVARFEREVFATTKLRHPNTVRVYDFGLSAEGMWYYAMELLDGETVAQIVGREGPLPVDRSLHLLRQAARALAEAHAQGIIHRDIKPENLFVSNTAGETDFIKVLDFGVASVAAEATREHSPTEPLGVARLVEDIRGEDELEPTTLDESPRAPISVTDGERAVGTPLYISPEVARGRAADPRSDIYALGCVLYFMLTSRPVFADRDARALLRAHVEREPTPPSEQLTEPLPYYVETVIMRCLAKDPKLRYQNVEALVRAIDLCRRLHDNDRRRGAAELIPRVRDTIIKVEEWAEQGRTETDLSLD